MKIAIIGMGRVGSIIAKMLQEDEGKGAPHRHLNYTLFCFDQEPKSKLVAHLNIDDWSYSFQKLSNADPDLIVSCLPYDKTFKVAQLAASLGKNYIDLTEDWLTTKKIKEELILAENTYFISQCGLAPGVVSIKVVDMIKDQLNDSKDKLIVNIKVGAIPEYPTGSLKYDASWSLEGLVNQYSKPCPILVSGSLVLARPLEDLETFHLFGVNLEAFNTSGGIGSLCEVFRGNENISINYKSIRYHGHRDLVKNIMQKSSGPEEVVRLFKQILPLAKKDVVYIFIEVKNITKMYRQTYAKRITSEKDITALQLTTASAVCAVIELIHDENLIVKSGINGSAPGEFLLQEEIPWNLFKKTIRGQLFEQ